MKQTLFVLMLLMLFSCAKEENLLPEKSQTAASEDIVRLYALKRLETPVTRGVAPKENVLWTNGQTIRIKFLNGTVAQHNKVKQYAAEWLDYANLEFEYVEADEHADVKIAFDWNDDPVSWSYLGKQAIYMMQDQPSTNFANLSGVDAMARRDILMQFGHILGLENEHNNLDAPIDWNYEAAYTYYNEQYGWTRAKVDEFFFKNYTTADVYNTPYDSQSIMVWPIPAGLTNDFTPVNENYNLSDTDKEFIAFLYPKTYIHPEYGEATVLTFEITETTQIRLNSMLKPKGKALIDYGNGRVLEETWVESPTYSPGTYEVKVWAHELEFLVDGDTYYKIHLPLVKCFLSKDTKFTKFRIYYTDVKRIEFTSAPDFTAITEFVHTFLGSRYLQSIPEDIFKRATNALVFNATFESCTSLTTLPENLFAHNTDAVDFLHVFRYCNQLTTLPEKLFSNNRKMKRFLNMFYCNPDGNIESIPEKLFYYNAELEEITGSFYGMRKITTLPEDLFVNNTMLKRLDVSFGRMISLSTIPSGLFRNNVNIVNFQSTFTNCSNLTAIPSELFRNNINVTDFGDVFNSCTSLTTIPEDLFLHNTNVTSFSGAFSRCTGLTYALPLWTMFSSVNGYACYYKCTNASNYNSIPSGWK